jgi:hypothetical protein
VVGIDPNDPSKVIVAWQSAPGLIVWKSVERSMVPDPVYIFKWDAKTRTATQRKTNGKGWSTQPNMTLSFNIDGQVINVVVGVTGAIAGGVAAANAWRAMPSNPIGGH